MVGQRTDDEPPHLVGAVHEYAVTTMIPNQTKNEVLAFLYRVLRFLMKNVHESDSFLLARHYSQRHHKDVLNLYRLPPKNRSRSNVYHEKSASTAEFSSLDIVWNVFF